MIHLETSNQGKATVPNSNTPREVTDRRWPPDASPTLAGFVWGHFPSEQSSSLSATMSPFLSVSVSVSLSPGQSFLETLSMFLVRVLLFVCASPSILRTPFLTHVTMT